MIPEKSSETIVKDESWVKPLEQVKESRDERRHGWFAVYHDCFDDLCKLGPHAVAVYSLLASFANRKRVDNCRPSLSQISEKLGMGKAKTILVLKDLVDNGFVGFEKGGSHRPSAYTLLERPKSTVLTRTEAETESTVLSRTEKSKYGSIQNRKTESTVLTRTAKDKEERKEEKNKNGDVAFSPGGGPSLETQNPTQTNFSWKTFSTLYPDHRKNNGHMDRAEEAFGKLGSADRQQACLALAEWIESSDWRREDGRYVPAPEKFLAERDRYWRRAAKSNHKREVEAMWQHFIDAGQLAKSVNKLTPDRRGHMQHRYEEAVAMRSEAEAMDVVRSAIDAYFADRRRQKDPGSANLDALFGTAEGFERWVKKGNA